jgi:hypothetical protein
MRHFVFLLFFAYGLLSNLKPIRFAGLFSTAVFAFRFTPVVHPCGNPDGANHAVVYACGKGGYAIKIIFENICGNLS